MQIKTPYESTLKLEDIYISECSFKRSESDISDLKLNLHIDKHIDILIPNERYKVSLSVQVDEDDARLSIFVNCIGIFSIQNQPNQDLIHKNAIAIMFPYVRSYVSTISTQPGMMPIVIPAINITALFSDQ